MGFFSWECEECGISLRSRHATEDMTQVLVTVILEDGEVVSGEYDGYGRVGGFSITEDAPTCYHTSCWHRHGKPRQYRGESKGADDQGFFFDEKELI